MPIRTLIGVGAMVATLVATPAQACSRPYPEAWIFFEPNSAAMWEGSKPSMKALVDRFAGVDRRCYRLEMSAHLDGAEAIGDRSDLSERRMQAVEAQLALAGLIVSTRNDQAYDQPLVQTPFGIGDAQNRRVVVRWSWAPGGRFVTDPYVKDEVDYCSGPPVRYVLADGFDCGYQR